MKNAILPILLLLFQLGKSQDTINQDPILLISSDTLGLVEWDTFNYIENEEGYYNIVNEQHLKAAFDVSVIDYFDLNEKYDTDLKKKAFKDSSLYKVLLDSLKGLKEHYLNSMFYYRMPNYSSNHEDCLGNYILEKRGFEIIDFFDRQKSFLIQPDEKTALEMEIQKKNIELLISFRIRGIINNEIQYANKRLTIYNDQSKQVYFDKLYSKK